VVARLSYRKKKMSNFSFKPNEIKVVGCKNKANLIKQICQQIDGIEIEETSIIEITFYGFLGIYSKLNSPVATK
jgi:YbbR domain-containing protein